MLSNLAYASAPVVSSNKATFCQGDFTAKLSLYTVDQDFFYYWQKQLPDLSWQDISTQQYIQVGSTDLYTPDLSNTLNYRVRYSLDISMSLESYSNEYRVTVNLLPSNPVSNIVSLPYNGNTQFANVVLPSGQSPIWYAAANGVTPSTQPSGINAGEYNSYAVAKIDATGCVSSARALIKLTINKVQLTIADPTITRSKEYDKTVAVASLTAGALSGVVSVGSVADIVTVSAVGTYNTSSVGTGKTITVVYTLAGADKDNYIKPVDKVYTDGVITAKQLIVIAVASDKPYDGNKNANVILSSSNKLSGDNVIYPYVLAEFDTPDVGNNKTVTVTGISLAGADAPNYVLSSTTATAVANITGSPIPFAIPNAFTPNGDGKNDKFKIIFNNPTGASLILQIFNRNGVLLFTSTDMNKEWDGTSLKGAMQDMGIYFVKYRIQIAGGMTYEGTPRLYLLK
jgi:gliding motility-associated-like protein